MKAIAREERKKDCNIKTQDVCLKDIQANA